MSFPSRKEYMARWDGLNRRKFPRVIYPCLVVIQNGKVDDRDVILTHTENIGIGGVCVIGCSQVSV